MTLPAPSQRHPVSWRSSAPFLAAHLVPVTAVFTGVTGSALAMVVVLYVVRIWFITAGYHRYFAHRSYAVGRATQLVLAFGGLTAAQKGPLWWAAAHRIHHRHADTDRDPHSPQMGFWWSHMGWVLSGRYGHTDLDVVKDLAGYPELRFLDRHDWIGPWSLAAACWLLGGSSGLVIGFFGSTVAVWHTTFAVNSIGHVLGRRRYATTDSSRNLWPLALLTLGEGWHNNHHHHPGAARQGLRWWELDLTYLSLRALAAFGAVRDIRRPGDAVIASHRTAPDVVDVGRVRQHLARATAAVPPCHDLAHALDDLSHHCRSARPAAPDVRERALHSVSKEG